MSMPKIKLKIVASLKTDGAVVGRAFFENQAEADQYETQLFMLYGQNNVKVESTKVKGGASG